MSGTTYRFGASGERLSRAKTPSASPALRISGCSIEASYCAHNNHGTVQIGGKLTGASLRVPDSCRNPSRPLIAMSVAKT